MSRRAAVFASLCVLAAVGCAHRRAAPTAAPPPLPSVTDVTPQTKCGVRRSADKPLVVEWPAADRAALEASARRGIVAVRYEGCEMEVLSGCDVEGGYEDVALTRKQERVTIRDADELYARLPVGAASLEGKLARAGELVVDMTIVGRKQADRHVVSRDELSGRCESATHVLTGLTVGAFSMYAGATTEASAEIGFARAGVGGGHTSQHELLASDGDPSRCDTSWDDTGVDACAALLRVEAVPIAGDPEPLFAPASSTPASVTAPTGDPLDPRPLDTARTRSRAQRQAAAWRGTAIASGVLAGASFSGIVGGTVLLVQYKDDTFGIDVVPTEADLRKRKTGTGLLIGGTAGLLGFTTLAVAARQAAVRNQRHARIAPSVGPTFAGVVVSGRF